MVSNISEIPTVLHLSLKIGAAGFFKTMIITDDISWCHSPEGYRLNFYYCENLKPHTTTPLFLYMQTSLELLSGTWLIHAAATFTEHYCCSTTLAFQHTAKLQHGICCSPTISLFTVSITSRIAQSVQWLCTMLDWVITVHSMVRTRDFSFLQNVQTNTGDHPGSSLMCIWGSFLVYKVGRTLSWG